MPHRLGGNTCMRVCVRVYMCVCCTSAFLHRTLIYKILTTWEGDSSKRERKKEREKRRAREGEREKRRKRGEECTATSRRHEACGRSNNSANFLLIASKRQISRKNFAFTANKVAGGAGVIIIIIIRRNMIIMIIIIGIECNNTLRPTVSATHANWLQSMTTACQLNVAAAEQQQRQKKPSRWQSQEEGRDEEKVRERDGGEKRCRERRWQRRPINNKCKTNGKY